MRKHHVIVLAALVSVLSLSFAIAQQRVGQPRQVPADDQQAAQDQPAQQQQAGMPDVGGAGAVQDVRIAEQPVEVSVVPGRPTQWDYDVLVVLAPSNPQEGQRIQRDLAQRGAAGWELVDSFVNNGAATMMFKRPRQ